MNGFDIARLYIVRLGKILSNLSIVFCVLAIFTCFSFILNILYFLCLILIVVITLGIIFVVAPNFGDYFNAELMGWLFDFMIMIAPYFSAGTFALAGLSTVCLSFAKKGQVCIWRICFNAIIMITSAVLFTLGMVIV